MSLFDIVLLFLFGNKLIIALKMSSLNQGPCLPNEMKASWTRKVFHDRSPLIIESTRRPSHKVVSFILAILMKERLGYEDIFIREMKWVDVTETLDRLTCNKKRCKGQAPPSHINLEVWMSPGFTSSKWVNDGLIIDCGPLGPSARTGVFYYADRSSEGPIDDWRLISQYADREVPPSVPLVPQFKQLQIYKYCNESYNQLCSTKFAIDPDLPLDHAGFLNRLFNKWEKGSEEADSSHYLYFNWYPNTITVQYNFSRVLFPDCNEGLFSLDSDMCEDSVNQLTKVVWSGLKNKAPLIYRFVDSFQLSDEELLKLLKMLKVHSNNDEDYFTIACDWILKNKESWIPLTPLWNSTKYLNIIVLLPKTGSKISKKEEYALQHALKKINKETRYFGSLQYQLQVKYSYISCGPNERLEEYLNLVNIDNDEADNSIFGIITGLPTECMESIYKISHAQRKVTISFRHEIFPMLLRYGNSSYIFQTSPSKETYYALHLKISKHFGWNKTVIIANNDDFMRPFTLKGNKFDHINDDFFKFLKYEKENKNSKIFFVDFVGDDIFQILCFAGRLGMTSENDYVWFINMALINRTIPKGLLGCSAEILSITKSYFFLTPYDDNSIEHCHDPYPDNLHRAISMMGHVASAMTKLDPELTAFNADSIVNNINEIKTSQYFCKGIFVRNISLRMEHNSLYWPLWYMYSIRQTQYVQVFEFKISKKYEIRDNIHVEIKQIRPAFDGPIPDDGSRTTVEKCWANFMAVTLNIKCTNAEILVIISVTTTLLIIFVISLLLAYRKKIKENNYPISRAFKVLVEDLLDINIHSSKLFLNHIIGRGAFGMVYGGEARNNDGVLEAVAVKAISENSDWGEKMNFLTEAKVMRRLRHPNIVELTGVSLDSENNMIFLIMELMVEGDLRNYLLSRRSNAATNPDSKELRRRLTDFSRDVAEGLNYMHSKFMVHRDVACRNCLISHDIRVKLGDFGLTQYLQPAISDGCYKFQGNLSLPVRWMPPEAIQFGLFSIKSDIWSFGILLFEIVTFGVCPYQDLSSSKNMELMELIKTNHLSIVEYLPFHARDSIAHRLISQCCSFDRHDRPNSIEQVLAILKTDKTCIRPYLTDDPPKSEVDKKLNNLSVGDIPRLVFAEEELPVTSPSEVQLASSQRYIDMINRAFRIKPNSMKERTDFPMQKLRPCQSSVTISRDLLVPETSRFLSFDRPPDLLVGSIPSNLCHDMGQNNRNRAALTSFCNAIKLPQKGNPAKLRFPSRDL